MAALPSSTGLLPPQRAWPAASPMHASSATAPASCDEQTGCWSGQHLALLARSLNGDPASWPKEHLGGRAGVICSTGRHTLYSVAEGTLKVDTLGVYVADAAGGLFTLLVDSESADNLIRHAVLAVYCAPAVDLTGFAVLENVEKKVSTHTIG